MRYYLVRDKPNVSFDFDGVIHLAVYKKGDGYHPEDGIRNNPDKLTKAVNYNILPEIIKEYNNNNVHIITARWSREKDTVIQTLKQIGIYHIFSKIICTNKAPKSHFLKLIKAHKHYDDSESVMKDIELHAPHIEAVQVFPEQGGIFTTSPGSPRSLPDT